VNLVVLRGMVMRSMVILLLIKTKKCAIVFFSNDSFTTGAVLLYSSVHCSLCGSANDFADILPGLLSCEPQNNISCLIELNRMNQYTPAPK